MRRWLNIMSSPSPTVEPAISKLSLTLMNVTGDAAKIDSGQSIETLINNSLSSKCIALSNKKIDTRKQIVESILRFRLDTDKILSLCSILLKSRAYHQSSDSDTDKNIIVDIPRTKYRKPYLPEGGELSLSHQYPYIGLLLEVIISDEGVSKKKSDTTLIGFDIVVFEGSRHQDEETFLECFQGSFTGWEWEQIIEHHRSATENKLAEFYLRWAMKEAYTKALGVGLGLEFSTFEVRIEDRLWDKIVRDGQTKTRSKIKFVNETKEENWEFMFFNLVGHRLSSCACVAVGGGSEFIVDLNWMSLEELQAWHKSN